MLARPYFRVFSQLMICQLGILALRNEIVNNFKRAKKNSQCTPQISARRTSKCITLLVIIILFITKNITHYKLNEAIYPRKFELSILQHVLDTYKREEKNVNVAIVGLRPFSLRIRNCHNCFTQVDFF
jgi:hypothetical protein